jgi:maltooligosyltrehalose trehalohydrolase
MRRVGTLRPDGAVLSATAFVMRFRGGTDGDRALIVNLGCDLDLLPIPEPLLAPPAQCRWVLQWSSASVRYGGQGRAPLPDDHLHIPGETAILLRSEENVDGHADQ